MRLDVCPRCRIQAPHRPGRTACPRCGGPLTVTATTSGPVPEARPPSSAAPRRVFVPPRFRWVATRPPEARDRPRPPRRPRPPGIPAYRGIPGWGLIDPPPAAEPGPDAELEAARERLRAALVVTAWTLTASVVLHVLRYAVLMINRDQPISATVDIGTAVAVIAVGVAAIGAYLWATVDFVRWLRAERAAAYRRVGGSEPRPLWQIILMAGVPVVHLVGAAILGAELIRLDDDPDHRPRLRARLTRIWVAWLIVTAVAVIALIVRVVAFAGDSIQGEANSLYAVIISTAVSAVFAFWATERLPDLLAAAHSSAPTRRWLVVGVAGLQAGEGSPVIGSGAAGSSAAEVAEPALPDSEITESETGTTPEVPVP